MKKPVKLHKGDTIGIVAPASGIADAKRLIDGINVLKSSGYKVLPGKSCFEKHGYLSGTDLLRAYDINTFFSDPDVNAIVCLRGGYGSIRIIDKINYDLIKENVKIFVGYSDITALLFSIFKECNFVTFHGPMVSSDISDNDPITINSFLDCLEGGIRSNICELTPLIPGNCSGRIFGGNLSTICSIIGSKYYDINWNNRILFIEDINEEPYSIDRMLCQLKLSGIFKKIKGVLIGQFTSCDIKEPGSQSVIELFNEFFYNFRIPVYTGLMSGHELHKITIPLGIKVTITDNNLKFAEEGVE